MHLAALRQQKHQNKRPTTEKMHEVTDPTQLLLIYDADSSVLQK
jgi:hypothetical protein